MKYKIITLGCKVNTYESNAVEDEFRKQGLTKVNSNECADIVIINTCTVTNTANNKSLKMVRSSVKNNPGAIIIVIGCATQVYKEKFSEIDGVSIILGNIGKSRILQYIDAYKKNQKQIIDVQDNQSILFEPMKLNNFNKTRAFVKIQDGCNNFCSYCIIPYARGNVRSRCKEEIFAEIRELIGHGHSEIVLTGIHTGHYGSDLDNYSFANLLSDIVKVPGLKRLRISSIEITEITDDVLEILKNESILVSHLHIPLQAGNDKILKLMNRKYNLAYFNDKLQKIRNIRPDISITTDIIVGFPGETTIDFENSLSFIKKQAFSKIHVFPYSRRSGTLADTFKNQVSQEEKKERVHMLLKLSRQMEEEYMQKFLNQEISFLPETYKDGYLIGHTGNYLLIKCHGQQDELNKDKKVIIRNIVYPYCTD